MPSFDIVANYPPILDGFFDEWARFYILYGGRGSGKSWSVAQEMILSCLSREERILCCREHQNSIRQSVKRLLVDTMRRMGCRELFIVRDQIIYCPLTGSEILFSGLWGKEESIRSMEGITKVWIEEGQAISPTSMEALQPTIRSPGSSIYITMNPRLADDYVYVNFIAPEIIRPDAKRLRVNYVDNPWFKDTELVNDMEWDKRTDPGKYRHVWLGELNFDDKALVFVGNVSMEHFFTPENAQFMFGQDYGFSQDPMAFVRSFMSDDERTLYVDYEAGGMTRLSLFDHPREMDEIPQARQWPIKADSARPDYIVHLENEGFLISPTEKYNGSVEDGISWLQSVNIKVHPRCRLTWEELRTHKFLRHAQTQEVTRKPEDKNNHYIDALRYAWQSKWRRVSIQIG